MSGVRQLHLEIGRVVGEVGKAKLHWLEAIAHDFAGALALLELPRVCRFVLIHLPWLVLARFRPHMSLRLGRRRTINLHSALRALASFSIQLGMTMRSVAMAWTTETGVPVVREMVR